MDEWRSIDTAPQDGTDILVCVTHNLPDGTWETIQWVDWRRGPDVWPVFRDRIDIPFAPTKWMPLPAPPTLNAATPNTGHDHRCPAFSNPQAECKCMVQFLAH